MKLDAKAVAALAHAQQAGELIRAEEQHLGEVDKLLRKPGDIGKAEVTR